MGNSRWAAESLRVIRATLKAMPADADYAARKAALTAAYPFGLREHHPYKVWCKCATQALRPYKAQDDALLFPKIKVNGVSCPWCRGKGCISCAAENELWRALKERGLLPALGRFNSEPLIFADWCEENGFPEKARRLREEFALC